MMNRFVCHLSSLSGEQWYGSQRERGEGDMGGKKNSILNRIVLQPAQKISALWTYNNPPNETCQILFLKILSGSYFSAVMSRIKSLFHPKPCTVNHYWIIGLPYYWNGWEHWMKNIPCSQHVCTGMHTYTNTDTYSSFEFIITLQVCIPLTTYIDKKHVP